WTAERAGELVRLIERVIGRHRGAGGIEIDMGRVERLDTFGAWLLERLLRGLAAGGSEARVVGLPDRYRDLVAQARHINRTDAAPPPRPVAAALAVVGRTVGQIGRDIVLTVAMIGAL